MNLIRIFVVATLSFCALETSGSEIKDSLQDPEVYDTVSPSSVIDVPATLNDTVVAHIGSDASDALVPTVTEVPGLNKNSGSIKRARSEDYENPKRKKIFLPFRIVISRENLYEDLLSAFRAEKPENVHYHGFEIRMKDSEGAEEEILKITFSVLRNLDLGGVLRRLNQNLAFHVDKNTGETIIYFNVDPAKLRLFGFVSALIAKHNLQNGVRLPGAVASYLRNPNQSLIELMREQNLGVYNYMITTINNFNPTISKQFSFTDYEKPCLRANPHPQTPAEMQEYFEYVASGIIQPDRYKYIKEGFELVMSSEMIAACEMTAADFNRALTDYSDYTGNQLRAVSELQNIEGNRHLIEWFFAAIDQLTPHERRMFYFFVTGLNNIPRQGLGSLGILPKLFIMNDLDRFNSVPTIIYSSQQITIILYPVESSEKMLENLEHIARTRELKLN